VTSGKTNYAFSVSFSVFRLYTGDGHLRRVEIKNLNLGKTKQKTEKKVHSRHTVGDLHAPTQYKNNMRCRQYIIVFLLRVYSSFIYDFPSSSSLPVRAHIILSAVFASLYQISRDGKTGRQVYEEHQSASRVVGRVRLFTARPAGARRVLFYDSEVCRFFIFFKHQNDSCPLNPTV